MSATTYPIRVDEEVKKGASEVAAYYGFDLASVTRALWKQMIRTKSIPLALTREEPNEESLEAIHETEEIIANRKSGKGYKTAEDMFAALGI